MNKLGIWGLVIAGAFVIGVLSANPVVEAVGGWQPAVDGLDARVTALENNPTTTLYKLSQFVPALDPQSVLFDCNPGDTAISGYTIVPPGVSVNAGFQALNNGESIIVGVSSTSGFADKTFVAICASGIP